MFFSGLGRRLQTRGSRSWAGTVRAGRSTWPGWGGCGWPDSTPKRRSCAQASLARLGEHGQAAGVRLHVVLMGVAQGGDHAGEAGLATEVGQRWLDFGARHRCRVRTVRDHRPAIPRCGRIGQRPTDAGPPIGSCTLARSSSGSACRVARRIGAGHDTPRGRPCRRSGATRSKQGIAERARCTCCPVGATLFGGGREVIDDRLGELAVGGGDPRVDVGLVGGVRRAFAA